MNLVSAEKGNQNGVNHRGATGDTLDSTEGRLTCVLGRCSSSVQYTHSLFVGDLWIVLLFTIIINYCSSVFYSTVTATNGMLMFHVVQDTELARSYEIELAEWYVPLSVYTGDVDYREVTVQVPATYSRGRLESNGNGWVSCLVDTTSS